MTTMSGRGGQEDIEATIEGLADAVKAAAELLRSLAPVIAEIRGLQQALGDFERVTGGDRPIAPTLREVAR
ncbi:MAG: hypothetical protein U0531_12710 [Dehalococcoidia bacterium]